MTTSHVFLPPEAFVGLRLDGAVDEARCSELVERLELRGFEATGSKYPGGYRNNDRLVFDDRELAASLFADVRGRLPQHLEIDGDRWELVGLNSRFRACRYRDGQSFCIHRDGPYAPEADVRSHLTLQLYLDDDGARSGGHTRFYADPKGEILWASIAPRRGTAIVFDHRAWHDGEAVTAGIKHVLRTDVVYRRAQVTATEAAAPASSGNVRVLYRHRGYAWHVIACRDGSIASAGRDGTVRRHCDGATATSATIELGAGSVTRLAEASDGRIWCGTRAGAIFVLDGLRVTRVADEHAAILDLAARPDGGIVAATALGTLTAFERNGARAWTREIHAGWAWSVIRDGDGYLSCGHAGQVVVIDDHGNSREVARLAAPLRALARCVEHILVGDTLGMLHRLDRDGHVLRSWPAHRAAITGIATLTTNRYATSAEDGHVITWSSDERVAGATAGDFVTSVTRDRDGRLLFTSYDGSVAFM